jgi:hypothetical protein
MAEKQSARVEELDPFAVADYVLERLALPKPGPLFKFLSPKSILKTLGVKTLDEVGEEVLEKIRSEVKGRKPF